MDDASKSIPFGYTLVNNANSDAPSGPPLLDNHESGYLQTFFDNPNNIDPSFLGGSQAERTSAGQDAFLPRRGSHQQNWMVDANAAFSGAATAQQPSSDRAGFAAPGATAAPPTAVAAQPPRAPYGSTGFNPAFPSQQQRPPDDVYAAARLLHSSQSPQARGQGDAPAFRGVQQQQQPQPDPKAAGNAPYSYPQPPSTAYAGLSQGYAYPNGRADAQQAPRSERPNPKQTRQLNFGSDSKFRMNKYAAPKNERWPDHDFVNAVIASHPLQHGWDDEQARSEAAQAAQALSRKRRRTPREGDESDGSDEEDEGTEHKRIKGEAGDGDGEQDGASKGKNGGKRKGARASSPTKNNRSPDETPKPAKENLSEEQKRANHIQSEQKRRNLIRQGFEDANRMVPELRAGGFSKSNMLLEAAKFMRVLKHANQSMSAVIDVLDKG